MFYKVIVSLNLLKDKIYKKLKNKYGLYINLETGHGQKGSRDGQGNSRDHVTTTA
jgi:hypothetical protein